MITNQPEHPRSLSSRRARRGSAVSVRIAFDSVVTPSWVGDFRVGDFSNGSVGRCRATETTEPVGSDALVGIAESCEDGPARNRTANPLIKSASGEQTEGTSDHQPRKKSGGSEGP